MEKVWIKLSIVLLVLLLSASCLKSEKPSKNRSIEMIMRQVSEANLEKTISDLVSFQTRFPYKKQIAVANYLYERLKQYLPETTYHTYEYWGVEWKNVIGTIVGKRNPNDVVVVCAHMDSKSSKRLVYAPGADDNASGCAAVLELARILSTHSFNRTIRFIIFSREESGQNGSRAYLKQIDKNSEKIIAGINLDMVAYGKDTDSLHLVTRPKYRWLADKIYNLSKTYGLRATKVVKKGCY